MDVHLIPFPPGLVETAWEWLNESPKMNFDDYGPQSVDELLEQFAWRSSDPNEYLFAVLYGDEPVGVIGATRLSNRLALFHGICFAKAVHGKGIAREAVQHLMVALVDDGVERIEATFFADNGRVRRFLAKLGFRDEGILRARTVRGGRACDARIMGWLASTPVEKQEVELVKRGGAA